ncbi:unnamed protein product [Didymodactylos carnosus]|uniref:Apple domain-containing protein n=1 Tax=Didymodactylos carnosus TaxID=1234261 RepID=A0A815VHN3_9BILA|nr:unnamed protein product [Didymodactylos carnosus]CAF1530605.1 unnamed protein product [Didymodactylos carnosus]CAF4200244.1 unnamed protein product [Didymodactylos carnosus]CAF4389856.1 unnamed protein product [Didymodactylos carnosus]
MVTMGNIDISNNESTNCGVCHGINSCCNNCQDVIDVYKQKRWTLNPNKVEQCQKNCHGIYFKSEWNNNDNDLYVPELNSTIDDCCSRCKNETKCQGFVYDSEEKKCSIKQLITNKNGSFNQFAMSAQIYATNILMHDDDFLVGVCNTTVGDEYSLTITEQSRIEANNHLGLNRCQYLEKMSVRNIIDNDLTTKYLNFGNGIPSDTVGVGTGFVVVLSSGLSVLTGVQFATGSNMAAKDPLTITIECSNATTSLENGIQWRLIYEGSNGCGAQQNIGRQIYCPIQDIQTNVSCRSYRLLIQSQRGIATNIQYSEAHLLGYFIK